MKTIAVFAPAFVDNVKKDSQNYIVRIKGTNRELALSYIYDLIKNKYSVDKEVPSIAAHESDFSTNAAGYYLTSFLRKAGYDTILLKTLNTNELERLSGKDICGICISTTMITHKLDLKRIVDTLRYKVPDTKIYVGGLFVWKSYLNYREAYKNEKRCSTAEEMKTDAFIFPCNLQDMDVDAFIVSPHGVPTLLKVLKESEKGVRGSFETIPNLAIRNGLNEYTFTEQEIEDIDNDKDYTRWDLLTSEEMPTRIPLRSSIGCPYRCKYCDFWSLYHKVFIRSAASIREELNSIDQKKIVILDFVDENFFIQQKRVPEICRIIKEKPNIVYWSAFMRASNINTDNIDMIRDSGLIVSRIGVESGDQNQLNRMKKEQSLEDMARGIELLDAAGIISMMSLIVGFPGETDDTIKNTANFLNNLKVSYARYDLFPLYVFPSSAIGKDRETFGLKGIYDNWRHATMNSEEAIENCYRLFSLVSDLPYNYTTENHFFNIRFDKATLRKLNRSRNNLTVQLIEKHSVEQIQQTFKTMAELFGVGPRVPSKDFINKLRV